MGKACLQEEWFIEDHEAAIDEDYPLWGYFGKNPKEALHEIYVQSRAIRVWRVLGSKSEDASGTGNDEAYKVIETIAAMTCMAMECLTSS